MSDTYELLMWTSQNIGYVQRRPSQCGYNARNIGKGEGFIFAQHGGRGSRGGHGNDIYQAAVPGRNNILHE